MPEGRSLDRLSDLSQAISDICAARFGIDRDAVRHPARPSGEPGALQAAFLKLNGQGRATGDADDRRRALTDETADLVAQLPLFARRQDIDPPDAIARIWGRALPKAAYAPPSLPPGVTEGATP